MSLWRHADFLRLWAGQTVSQFGSQITLLALPLTAALTLHASAAEMGLLTTFGTAPYLLVGLFTGVLVDRMRRRPILIVTDLGRFALLALIPALALADRLRMEYLYAVAFLVGVLTIFFEIAYEAFLPTLVTRDQLIDGNGKLETTRSAAQVAGPGVAGVLVQVVTAPVAILADALSFLASALFVWSIRASEPVPGPRAQGASVWREIGDGLRIVRRHSLLRPVIACTAAINLFWSMMQTLYVLYATRTLGIQPGVLGAIFAVGGIGLVVGALLAGRVTRRIGPGPTIIAGAVAMACGKSLVPLARGSLAVTVPVLIVSSLVSGFGGVIFNINTRSLRQSVTPAHLMGRVTATSRFLVWGGVPIGALAGGTLGAVFGLRPTLTIAAVAMLLAFLWPLCSPVRTLKAQPAPMEESALAA